MYTASWFLIQFLDRRRERERDGGNREGERERLQILLSSIHIVSKRLIICVQEIGFTLCIFYENVFTVKKTLSPGRKHSLEEISSPLKKIQIYNDAFQWKYKY